MSICDPKTLVKGKGLIVLLCPHMRVDKTSILKIEILVPMVLVSIKQPNIPKLWIHHSKE